MRRLFWILLIGFVFIALVWSGGWYALASWVEAKVPEVIAEIEQSGIDVDCPSRDVVGFPFAVQVACGPTAVAELQSGSAAEFGGVTGGVSVFAPMTAAVSLESPARIDSPLLPGGAQFQWESAAVAMGLGVGGPETATFEASGFVADVADAQVTAERASGSLAPASDGGTFGRGRLQRSRLYPRGHDAAAARRQRCGLDLGAAAGARRRPLRPLGPALGASRRRHRS